MTKTYLVEEIKRIAHLARITLTTQESLEFAEDFTTILNYVNRIKTLDLSKTQITDPSLENIFISRKDTVTDTFTSEQLFCNSKQVKKNHFVVPPPKTKF